MSKFRHPSPAARRPEAPGRKAGGRGGRDGGWADPRFAPWATICGAPRRAGFLRRTSETRGLRKPGKDDRKRRPRYFIGDKSSVCASQR